MCGIIGYVGKGDAVHGPDGILFPAEESSPGEMLDKIIYLEHMHGMPPRVPVRFLPAGEKQMSRWEALQDSAP